MLLFGQLVQSLNDCLYVAPALHTNGNRAYLVQINGVAIAEFQRKVCYQTSPLLAGDPGQVQGKDTPWQQLVPDAKRHCHRKFAV